MTDADGAVARTSPGRLLVVVAVVAALGLGVAVGTSIGGDDSSSSPTREAVPDLDPTSTTEAVAGLPAPPPLPGAWMAAVRDDDLVSLRLERWDGGRAELEGETLSPASYVVANSVGQLHSIWTRSVIQGAHGVLIAAGDGLPTLTSAASGFAWHAKDPSMAAWVDVSRTEPTIMTVRFETQQTIAPYGVVPADLTAVVTVEPTEWLVGYDDLGFVTLTQPLGRDVRMRRYDLDGQEVARSALSAVAFGHSGHGLAVDDDRSIVVVDPRLEPVVEIEGTLVGPAAWPITGGGVVALVVRDGDGRSIEVWNLDGEQLVDSSVDLDGVLVDLAWTRDRSTVVGLVRVPDGDDEVVVVDVATGEVRVANTGRTEVLSLAPAT